MNDQHQREVMAAAFQAIRNDDTAKRDSLRKDMERAMFVDAKERALRRLAEVNFFVRADGVVIASRDVKMVAL